MTDYLQPPEGCRTVSRAEFFHAIGPQDVNPHVRPGSLKGRHFASEWLTPGRRLLGFSVSDSWGIEPTAFWLCR